jgi:hypothetical protein
MAGYRKSYRYSRPQTAGRVAKANARPGDCRYCHLAIPANAGQLFREESGAWSVVHIKREWVGSPVSGQYTGGCPAETDRMNASGNFGGPDGPLSEYDRIASHARMHAPTQASTKYAYTPGGARMTERSSRCEDAPCCGCCD